MKMPERFYQHNNIIPSTKVQYSCLTRYQSYPDSAIYPVAMVPGVHNKIRRTFPSRMLSMIMDEEADGNSDTPTSADNDDPPKNYGSSSGDRGASETAVQLAYDSLDGSIVSDPSGEINVPGTVLCGTDEQTEV